MSPRKVLHPTYGHTTLRWPPIQSKLVPMGTLGGGGGGGGLVLQLLCTIVSQRHCGTMVLLDAYNVYFHSVYGHTMYE